jgi:flagellar biosynthetic protein FlhB
VGTLLAPLLLPLLLAALGVNVAQVGFNLSLKPLQPSLSKLNPINGMKRLFGPKGLVELGKSLFKIVVIGTVGTLTIRDKLPELLALSGTTVGIYLETVSGVVLLLGIRVVAALIVLSILDFTYQRYQHRKGLKMTKQEVKDELKQSEGDPMVKGRLRALMRQMARDRMMEGIKRADVVVTNPIHVAVALRYDPAKAGAPMVVAKGARKMAQRIKDIAREHEVPIVENPPLARQLFKLADVGDLVPASLYKAVAEVLAFVYRLKGRRVS